MLWLIRLPVIAAMFSVAVVLGSAAHAAGDSATGQDKPSGAVLSEASLPKESPLSTLLANTKALQVCKCSYEKQFTILGKNRSDLDKVSSEIYPYAIMSSNAYDSRELQISLPGWKRIKRLQNTQHGFSADLYASEDGKSMVVAFSGTNAIKDMWHGNLTKSQYMDADILFGEVLKDHREKKIIATGHSLGGGLAIHAALKNQGVDAFVFDASPRLHARESYGKYNNRIVLAYETGEFLSTLRMLFSTMKKIRVEKYKYNFLGGSTVREHSIENFAQCMYASITAPVQYSDTCKDNTIGR